MTRWLLIWAPVLSLFALWPGGEEVPEPLLFGIGLVFWVMGVLVAHRTASRGSLAGLFMLGGLFCSLFGAGILAGMGMQDREALSVSVLGLVGGLQLALDGAPVGVLLLNLCVYWGLAGAAVYTGSGSILAGMVLFALGPPALMAPSALLAWGRSRRGEQFTGDLRRAEQVLRWMLGLGFLAMMVVMGLIKETGNREYWIGFMVVAGIILTGLRKA